MQTKTYTVYKYNELTKEQQQKVLTNLHDINVDYDWWNGIYEDAKTIDLEITEFDLDRNRHAKGQFITSSEDTARLILENHGSTCKTHELATVFLSEYKKITPLYEKSDDSFDDLYSELAQQFLSDLLDEYSNILQANYEHNMSYEAIVKTIEANDYNFTEDGKLD